ncbi:hypothetical protein EYF80_014167 [Liparis tanakae]|uniref:Uncharacterized protein n=1 Tax=Liparis tanakae TaxID=230148 RepID=A0A4Z2ICJ6_9TELE|nr:hypothetical protein EYF80_014167 [Liparis tanakae]
MSVQVQTHIGPVGVKVIFILNLNKTPGPHGDVGFDLFPCSVHVLRHPRHLEHWLLVSAGCHDVGVGLLLDALNGGPLGAYNQPHHTVRHPHLDGGLSGQARIMEKCSAAEMISLLAMATSSLLPVTTNTGSSPRTGVLIAALIAVILVCAAMGGKGVLVVVQAEQGELVQGDLQGSLVVPRVSLDAAVCKERAGHLRGIG